MQNLCCRFVIVNVPRDLSVIERAIPLAIFQSVQSIRNHYIYKWLYLSTVDNLDIQDILDWNCYIERFNSYIQKIMTIPVILQNIRNPSGLQRKRDELIDESIIRQWGIVLGPLPLFGQTTNEHIKWLNYQKHKWDIQRKQCHQPSITSNNPQISLKNTNSMNVKIDTYIHRAAEHLHIYWCLVEHELLQIKIKVPRTFYVNYCTPIELICNQTQHSDNYERIIDNCSQVYYLCEYHLDENIFRDYYIDIMTDLSNPNIEGVYEMNVPLDFHLLIIFDCIYTLHKKHYRTSMLSNLY
ncbi:unnamed protein product [Rotaria sp. Silwood2]|nr:unnamed protein product [Rotaria sp. Silwood2]CAF4089860.1 unnamed protein product [Rotaria sp. Silwood2]